MSSQGGSRKDPAIESLRGQILARWRDEVRRDSEQAALIHKIGDQELEDHLPRLTDNVIRMLRGEPCENLDEEAARHGRQRRTIGFSIVPLLRELQILRQILTDMTKEVIGPGASGEEIERGRKTIINTIDKSMNASALHFTMAAEEERSSAQGEARELQQQRDRFSRDSLARAAQSGFAYSPRYEASQRFETCESANGRNNRTNRAAGASPSHIDRRSAGDKPIPLWETSAQMRRT
jgi:hypothetical protein